MMRRGSMGLVRALMAAGMMLALAAGARAQGDEKAAVEMAAMRYAQACTGGDIVQMYRLATRELRIMMRVMASMRGSSIDPSQTEDVEGFRRLVEGEDGGREVAFFAEAGVGYVRFTRVVGITVTGDLAECFVFDQEARRREERRPGEPRQERDPSAWEKVLITTASKPAAADAEKAVDPRKEATAMVLLRREGKEWRVSMTSPVGMSPLARRERSSPAESDPVDDKAVMDGRVGELTVRKIVESATSARRAFGGAMLLDVYGPMSDGFRKFVVSKVGKEIQHAYVDLSMMAGSNGEVFLMNPNSPTVGDMADLTDKKLWDLMVEYAKASGK